MILAISALCAALAVGAPIAAGASPPSGVIAVIDLARPFATRSPWRFTAAQGPEIDSPYLSDEKAPGEVRLCLRKGASGSCDPRLQQSLGPDASDALFAMPHYLIEARIVRGRAGAPLLWVQTASLHSGDGDQLILTQALAYRPASDRFTRVYNHSTGRNENQEVRFIEAGPLKGDIISVEPTQNAPFGFWVVVNAPGLAGAYRQVLRFRSATHYGDGNPLAVIDSEMPGIEQRLGLWRPGEPFPLPAGRRCPRPRLARGELWCG